VKGVTRLTKPADIEHRLLDLAYTTSAKITPTSLAYFAPCSIEDAERVLDDLATRGRLELESDDDGNLFYELRGRQQLGAPVPATPPTSTALVPAVETRPTSPVLAAVLSAFIPGAGHLYTGRIAAAVVWFIVVGLAYGLILPGLLLHVASIISASRSARRLNAAPGHAPRRLLFAPPH
jgi:TM2 domain-containing membrane protein YozV